MHWDFVITKKSVSQGYGICKIINSRQEKMKIAVFWRSWLNETHLPYAVIIVKPQTFWLTTLFSGYWAQCFWHTVYEVLMTSFLALWRKWAHIDS